MHKIPLNGQRGTIVGYALVDDEDYERVNALRWHINQPGRAHTQYARHCTGLYMHRLVAGIAKGDRRVVDHINRNGLDNRRANLRTGTQAQNMQNRISPMGMSTHRGVGYDGRKKTLSKRWIAQVKINGERAYFKRFATEAEAAAAARRVRAERMPYSVE